VAVIPTAGPLIRIGIAAELMAPVVASVLGALLAGVTHHTTRRTAEGRSCVPLLLHRGNGIVKDLAIFHSKVSLRFIPVGFSAGNSILAHRNGKVDEKHISNMEGNMEIHRCNVAIPCCNVAKNEFFIFCIDFLGNCFMMVLSKKKVRKKIWAHLWGSQTLTVTRNCGTVF
jgi:hypothetical protein